LERGAHPVLIDIRPERVNLHEARLGHLVTPCTKGVLGMHYTGAGCERDAIVDMGGAAV